MSTLIRGESRDVEEGNLIRGELLMDEKRRAYIVATKIISLTRYSKKGYSKKDEVDK